MRPPYPPGPWPADAIPGLSGGETDEYLSDLKELSSAIDNHCASGLRLSSGERLEGRAWIDIVVAFLQNDMPNTIQYQCGQSPQTSLLNILAIRANDNLGLLVDEQTGRESTTESRSILREFKRDVFNDFQRFKVSVMKTLVWTKESIDIQLKNISQQRMRWLVERTLHIVSSSQSMYDSLKVAIHAEAIDFLNDSNRQFFSYLDTLEEQRAESFLSSHWSAMVMTIIKTL